MYLRVQHTPETTTFQPKHQF